MGIKSNRSVGVYTKWTRFLTHPVRYTLSHGRKHLEELVVVQGRLLPRDIANSGNKLFVLILALLLHLALRAEPRPLLLIEHDIVLT